MMKASKDERLARKRERNRRDYEKSKAARDHVLLRLDPGGAASLDAAASSAGLSRAAFARMFLPALMAAAAPRLAAIDAARGASGESLVQFLGRALDEKIERGALPGAASPAAASEFDALFG